MTAEIDDNGGDRSVARRLSREYNTINWTDEDAADVRLPLSDDYLARVKARVLAAQTGAWRVDRDQEVGENWIVATEGTWDHPEVIWGVATEHMHGDDLNEADGLTDAEFIAHCRLDVPLLLLEIERLRAREARAIELMARALPYVEGR